MCTCFLDSTKSYDQLLCEEVFWEGPRGGLLGSQIRLQGGACFMLFNVPVCASFTHGQRMQMGYLSKIATKSLLVKASGLLSVRPLKPRICASEGVRPLKH